MSLGGLKIKVLFLGAGYGTRLARDLNAATEQAQSYRHLLGVPKALLPIAGKPILNHWIELFLTSGISLQDMFIICNEHYHKAFLEWSSSPSPSTWKFPVSNLHNDGSTSNENRHGANKDIHIAVSHFGLASSPLLIVAGDTLFLRDFSMTEFLGYLKQGGSSLVTHYRVKHDKDTKLTGILLLDEKDNRATDFLEKPDPSVTMSRLACPCFYLLQPEALSLLTTFLDDCVKHKKALEEYDATGKFVGWLIKHTSHPIHSYPISGRLDIGNLENLIEAERYFDS